MFGMIDKEGGLKQLGVKMSKQEVFQYKKYDEWWQFVLFGFTIFLLQVTVAWLVRFRVLRLSKRET